LAAALENMRVMVWPYPGPMAIVEECDGWRQMHVIDHWAYLGSIDAAGTASPYKPPRQAKFDVDTYHILIKPMLRGDLLITPLPVFAG
jgi:excinuclease Cho